MLTFCLCSPEVVEDARQNFAASVSTPIPPLPVAPVARRSQDLSTRHSRSSGNRSQHSSTRIPRRILPANQIFANEFDSSKTEQSISLSLDSSAYSQKPAVDLLAEYRSMANSTIPTIPSEELSHVSLDQPETPSTPIHTRTRRATIITRSPEAHRTRPSLEIDTVSPNHKEKSRSQHDLGRPITPVTRLEFELEQRE